MEILPDSETPSSGFTESTDIQTWADQEFRVNPNTKGFRDKKCLRDKLKSLVYAKMGVTVPADVEDQVKWDKLDDDEKFVAATYFLVGKPDFLLEVKNDEVFWDLQATKYRLWSQEAKEFRLALMESVVFRRITDIAEAKDVLQTMNQVVKDTNIAINNDVLTDKFLVKNLVKQYVEGIDGTVEDNASGKVFIGLADYIDSRTGTPFNNNGFRNLSCTFRGTHTADTVADELLTIMKGDY